MKSFFKYAACLAAMMLLVTACSKDDNGNSGSGEPYVPTLNIPAAGTPVQYVAAQENSVITFVELTADGTYIVGEPALVRGAESTTCVIEGKWKAKENNEYLLEGWGTMVVKVNEAGNAYVLSLTPADGVTTDVTVALVRGLTDDASRKLAASWNAATVRAYVRIMTKTFDKEYTQEELPQAKEDMLEYLNDVMSIVPESVREQLGDISELADQIDIAAIVQSDEFYTSYTLTTCGTVLLKSEDALVAGTWNWLDSKKTSISLTPPTGEPLTGNVSYRQAQLCFEPLIQEIAEVKERLGLLATLGLDLHVYLYFDKVN